MKISNNKIGPASTKTEALKSGKTEASKGLLSTDKSGAAKGSASAENVNVSERAQMMQKAKDIASDTSIDEAKVARLQKLIDEGKYKTDAKSIADRLVDEHLSIPD